MALTRTARLNVRCTGCQRAILSVLLPDYQVETRKLFSNGRDTERNKTLGYSRLSQRRSLSRSSSAVFERSTEAQTAARLSKVEERELSITDESHSKPWYLQLQQEHAEDIEPSPLAHRQLIPDIPENAPPVLQPLLEYLSIDAGLDYLSMFDLRNLDPPPALGANLIMIFGTARSERHLHTSADRFCRWLRADHQLRPHADGMLGKNEIKLRLKRRARRSRIMSAAGGLDRRSNDHVLQTGWVCVNVGMVGSAAERLDRDNNVQEGFAGFGRQDEGTRIVVQMLTEDKRGDVDLESLWKGVLNRAERKRAWNSVHEADPDTNSNSTAVDIPTSKSSVLRRVNPLSDLNNAFGQQIRHLNTGRHRQSFRVDDSSILHHGETHSILNPGHSLQRGAMEPLAAVGVPADQLESRISKDIERITEQSPALNRALTTLRSISRSDAVVALGQGGKDRTSTEFLQNFYDSIPIFRSLSDYACWLEIIAYGLDVQHPGFERRHLLNLLRDMVTSGIDLPRSIFLRVLQKMLLSPHTPANSIAPSADYRARDSIWLGVQPFRLSLSMSFEVLESMEIHGHDVSGPDIFTLLHLGMNNVRFRRPADRTITSNTRTPKVPRLNYYLREAINAIFPQPHPDSFTSLLLETYAQKGDWKAFYIIWENVAIAMRPRTAEMYTSLFNGSAASENIEECRKVLRRWVPEMAREQPSVAMTPPLAESMVQCFQVADIQGGRL
ncbi:MAG: ATPase synthesis protein 25 mitochondrial [Chrysothrix sp. TS-e1954]|nr:MAG: ATPase synthesis protein 25 mitochondrial [Chrysothrix sp. TS-e1954]